MSTKAGAHHLLETNSISVFELDRTWMFSLMAGVLSIGITHHEYQARYDVFKHCIERVLARPIFGWLLNSPILRIWPDIEVGYFADTQAKVRKLPFHRVNVSKSSAIFLCKDKPQVTTLRLHPEAVHYGVDEKHEGEEKTKNVVIKYLSPDLKHSFRAMCEVGDPKTHGAVDISGLAQDLIKNMGHQKPKLGETGMSAFFAFNMLDVCHDSHFTINWS